MDGCFQFTVLQDGGAVPEIHNSTYGSPDEYLWDGLMGGIERTESSIPVNADKALHYAPWFQGISIIAGDVARVPLDVFERDGDDDRIKRRDHSAWGVLNRKANRYMTAFTLRELLMSHALSWGNGYAAISRSNAKVTELVPLMPEVTEPIKARDGRVAYKTKLDDGTTEYYSADDVLHIRGLGTALSGFSVFRYARNSLGLGLATERHGSRFFANDAKPGVVLEYPHKLDKVDADKLLDQWEDRHKANTSRPALASGGLKISTLPISNEDAQFVDSRKYQRDEVASWLLLPPHKLGSDARLSYNSVEAEERAYVAQTLMRWFVRIQAECDAKLLTDREQKLWWYCEHNTGALIQGDFKTQADVAVQLKNAKIITQNEARKKFNLNTVEGGDVFENANTSSGTPATPPEAPDNVATARVFEELIVDRMNQFVRSECTSIKRLAKGQHPVVAIGALYERLEPKLVEALKSHVRAYASVASCQQTSETIAKMHCDESRSVLRELFASVQVGSLPAAVDATIKDWPNVRSQRVAEWIRGVK